MVYLKFVYATTLTIYYFLLIDSRKLLSLSNWLGVAYEFFYFRLYEFDCLWKCINTHILPNIHNFSEIIILKYLKNANKVFQPN